MQYSEKKKTLITYDKLVCGKSERSDWLFVGLDFTIRTLASRVFCHVLNYLLI